MKYLVFDTEQDWWPAIAVLDREIATTERTVESLEGIA